MTENLKLIPELFHVARVSGKTEFDTSFFVKNMHEERILIDGVMNTDMVIVLKYVRQ